MADSLAIQFVRTYPSKEPDPNWRYYLRKFVVPGIRWLWKNGTIESRTSIATRIAIWRGLGSDQVKALNTRMLTRETNRGS